MLPSDESINNINVDWESWSPTQIYEFTEKYKFKQSFCRQISEYVIKYLSPQSLSDPQSGNYDDNAIYNIIFAPIEKFICNLPDTATDEQLKQLLSDLKSSDQKSTLCGKIFKNGDVTYSCQECSLDPTCVVCIDCFRKSAHKDHHYRMSTSFGGGLCDCGDIEAWKHNHACTDHAAPTSLEQEGSEEQQQPQQQQNVGSSNERCDIVDHAKAIRRLPHGIAIKYLLVCQAAFRYAYDIFTWQDHLRLPDILKPDDKDKDVAALTSIDHKSDNYFTVLFNDEVHTYDQVISTLERVIKCTKQTASITASTISREGRSIVNRGNCTVCSHIKDEIRKVSERMANVPKLKVEVMHGAVLAHQAFASKLLMWIKDMSTYCDAFRFITATALLGPSREGSDGGNVTFIEQIMSNNTNFWKIVRVQWNEIIISIMLMDYKSKQIFATLFTRNYKKLMEAYIADDHEHSVSVTSMTVQVYTVPSLSYMMMEEENALEILSETFLNQCRKYKRDNRLSFERRGSSDIVSFRRAITILSDLEYLLHQKPGKWTDKLRLNFKNGTSMFIELLNWMQGMDSVKRQINQHVEYDPEWETGMTLQNTLVKVLGRLIAWATDDTKTLEQVLDQALTKFLESSREENPLFVERELWNHRVRCLQYEVISSPVSVHLPLTRFIAGLLLGYMPNFSNHLLNDRIKNTIVELIEPSLRTQVMIAQFRAGMWRRNGYSLVNQLFWYHNTKVRHEMLDRDVQMLQLGASMIDPNNFIIHLLDKYNLIAWAENKVPSERNQRRDDENVDQTISIAGEFLHLLLTLVNERHMIGIGKCSQDDILKNEVIQLLSMEPLSRSDLISLLAPGRNIELDCIESVANFKRPSPSVSGRYELKEEYYDKFNPFFYHYSRRDQSNAHDAQYKRKKAQDERLLCFPPPSPIEFTPEFESLLNILKCDVMLNIMKTVIERSLEANSGANVRFYSTEIQLEKVLHLIGLGLYEQERNPTGFNFIEEANKKDIFIILDKCLKLNQSKDLIVWVIEKFKSIVSEQSQNLGVDTVSSLSQIGATIDSPSNDSNSNSQEEKKKSQEAAAQRRARIMAQMKASQDRFLSNCAKQIGTDSNEEAKPTNHPASTSRFTVQPPQSGSSLTPANLVSRAIGSGISDTVEQLPAYSLNAAPRYNTRSYSLRKPIINMPVFRSSDSGSSTSSSKTNERYTSSKRSDLQNTQSNDNDSETEQDMDAESTREEEPDNEKVSYLCILCREEQVIGFDQPCMVLSVFVQRSTVLSKNRHRTIPSYTMAQSPPGDLENHPSGSESSDNYNPLFMSSDLYFGPHVSTCGHVMHQSCWQKYFESIERKERSRPSRHGRNNSYEIDRNEVLCPLCECISNSVIPILPRLSSMSVRNKTTIFSTSFRDMVNTSENLETCIQALHQAVQCLRPTRHLSEGVLAQGPLRPTQSIKLSSSSPSSTTSSSAPAPSASSVTTNDHDKYITRLKPRDLNEVLLELPEHIALSFRQCIEEFRTNRIESNVFPKSMLETMSSLSQRIYMIGLNQQPNQHDDRVPLMTYWAVSYTTQTMERLMRDKKQPIFQNETSSRNLCLHSLIKFSTASVIIHPPDVIQSHLLKILRYLLINEHHQASPPSCLDIDAFELLITLMIGLPKLYSNDLFSSNDKHHSDSCSWITTAYKHDYFRNILHMIVVFNLVQVITSKHMVLTRVKEKRSRKSQWESADTFNMDVDEEDLLHGNQGASDYEEEEEDVGEKDEDTLDSEDDGVESKLFVSFYQKIIMASGHPNPQVPPVRGLLLDIKKRMLPFLRCAALFFYHALEVSVPVEFVGVKQLLDPAVEFDSLCNYLNLPKKFNKLLESQSIRQFALSWTRHPRVHQLIISSLSPSTNSTSATNTQQGPLASNFIKEDPLLVGQFLIRELSDEEKGVADLLTSTQSTSAPTTTSISTVISQPSTSSNRLPMTRSRSSRGSTTPDIKGASTSGNLASSSSLTAGSASSASSNIFPLTFIEQPHKVNRLIDLPYDYSELINKVASFACPNVENEESRTPTLCLVCGAMLCSQSYCCQKDLYALSGSIGGASSSGIQLTHSLISNQSLVGSCTYHAYECCAGVGIFLRIRDCKILLISGKSKGCYMPAPYVDEYGETDFGLQRGNPLNLSRGEYKRLQTMWLQHSIPEQISRILEHSSYASSIVWHLH